MSSIQSAVAVAVDKGLPTIEKCSEYPAVCALCQARSVCQSECVQKAKYG